MKDSSVGPAGLFVPGRQRRLLDGLEHRFQSCADQQQILEKKHAEQRTAEEFQLGSQRATTTDRCRKQRRQMLHQWDEAEEKLTSGYEAKAIKIRKDLNRLGAVFRRKSQEETAAIERKVEARRQAVIQQYENRKNQPGQQNRKEIKSIDETLTSIHESVEWARALTIRRLDRLPEVPPPQTPEENMRAATPGSVQEAIDTVYQLTRECRRTVAEMQTGAASKIVDSFYLPAGVAVFIVFWAIGALVFGPTPPWLAMAAGVPIAGVIGFSIYLILLWPLKKMTRQLYPKVERIVQAAEECAESGRTISTNFAKETSAELIARRDAHIEATKRWKSEQLVELEQRLKVEEEAQRVSLTEALQKADQQYMEQFNNVGAEMRGKADSLAQEISQDLSHADQILQQERDASAARRHNELKRLAARMKEGVSRGMHRISVSDEHVRGRFPDWKDVLAAQHPAETKVEFLPVGSLRVQHKLREALVHRPQPTDGDQQADSEQATNPDQTNGAADRSLRTNLLADAEIPEMLPVVLHRRLHSGIVINAPSLYIDRAIDVVHQILWRLITGTAASRAKLTLIDPLGRGQNFTSFMALTDHDPSLVGHRVWTTDNKIEARLGELAHHIEDVLQSSLRDRFQRIEDYNEIAGSMAEPYRAVAAIGFPEGLTRDSYKHLRALVESGMRCGVFTILVCDPSNPWPADMPLPADNKMLRLDIDSEGQWKFRCDGLDEIPFVPAPSPPAVMRRELVEQIGVAAVAASRVEIPLETILSAADEGKGSTDDGIDIAVGSQGANRTLSLSLGAGVQQHVLIAGKTGSGKSTLLHAIITSGAHRYRPDQLQFFLLDFKKGVEFKPYAESGLPHARVIGIESEREFGRSVLQRLDEELQQRGEKFRACNAQELSQYRAASGQAMPRIMLVVDEFQELFVRDDRLAGDCAMLLDRLVRQGRSFGMHVILSSQSLAGAYSLPRATLGQMAVRIAMQCSEADAALILSDDNTAARLIARPGEAIYNNAGGLLEGNQPFQVAWLSSIRHREMLSAITARDEAYAKQLDPPVVFEGNRPCRWSTGLAEAALAGGGDSGGFRGLLGESVEIGPPVALELNRNTGRNILLIAPAESRAALIASTVSGLAKSNSKLKVVFFDGSRADDHPSVAPWMAESGINLQWVKPRDSEVELARLSELVKQRGDDAEDVEPIVVIVDPLERFRDFRQDESFNFSLDSPGSGASGATSIQNLLRDGPAANVFVLLVCGSAETLTRWLPRASQHDLELRILGRLNASDSSTLIDSPIASELSTATMLLYDDSDGRLVKFRQCDLPDAAIVKQWIHS